MLTDNIDKFERKPQLLQIIKYPSDILRKKSIPVTESIPHNQSLQDLMDDMVFTMQQMRAVGLSAIQVAVPIRVLVVQDTNLSPIKMVNPVIKTKSVETDYNNEGCLSVPSVYTRILRPKEIDVEYFDADGNLQQSHFNGLMARAIQHEIGHLEGELFLDLMHKIQRDALLKKYNRVQRKQ